MRHSGKWTATHWYLLVLTAVFFGLALYLCLSAPPVRSGSYRVVTGRGDGAETVEKIAINSASARELEKLRGIGPVLAERIVEYRRAHGPFTGPDDLEQVEGIGRKTAEELGNYVTWEVLDENTGGG